jgi:hypothetical protein
MRIAVAPARTATAGLTSAAEVEASLVGSVLKMSGKNAGWTALTLPAHAEGTSGPLRNFGDRLGMLGGS